MPLDKGCSTGAMSKNIKMLIDKEGKEQPQAVAIAYSVLRKACGVKSDAPKMTPKQIVGKKEEIDALLGFGSPIQERLAMSAEEAFKARREAERRAVEVYYKKPLSELSQDEIRWGLTMIRRKKIKPKYPRMPRGAKVHKGPTVFGGMEDKSRLGQAGKAVVKALQGVVDKFGMLGDAKRVEASVNLQEGYVWLYPDGAKVMEWWMDTEQGRAVIADHEEAIAMSDDYVRRYPRNEYEADAYYEEWWNTVMSSADDDLREEWENEAWDAFVKATKGTPFKPDRREFGMDEISVEFDPAAFGFDKNEEYEDAEDQGQVEVLFDLDEDDDYEPPLEEARSRELKIKMKLKDGDEIPKGTKITNIEFFNDGRGAMLYMPSFRDQPVKVSTIRLPKYVKGIGKAPGVNAMEKWLDSGRAKSVTGKTVEPDGTATDGSPSWMVVLGYI